MGGSGAGGISLGALGIMDLGATGVLDVGNLSMDALGILGGSGAVSFMLDTTSASSASHLT